MSSPKQLVALAGQPNCGKSTVFNAMTGASQHVANYPGVTVDKMTGSYRYNGSRVEVVDLPGTYSLTSYSPEERVTRDFLLHEKPSVVVNVMDASNLKRCLYLTFQLLEMEVPVILNLNMMDVATARGMDIDIDTLSQRLGIPAIPSTMTSGQGKKALLEAVARIAESGIPSKGAIVDYGEMEPFITKIIHRLASETALAKDYPLRWLAIKLMGADSETYRLIRGNHPDPSTFIGFVEKIREDFEVRMDDTPEVHIANRRYQSADAIAGASIKPMEHIKTPLSDKIDRWVCHKFLGPAFLLGVIWLLYYLSIVQGYNLTNYTWPLLAKVRTLTEAVAPAPGFIDIPLLRAFLLWFVDSINALLNYIPIFFILFGFIAILEDSGYMPRMAFIMDRLFSRFGLHGQSTLPMVLGGIYVGGCAVPGVMACKGIPDERSRLATILIIPMLNCLAKVPLYVLLVNIYFAAHKGIAMFFISTISMLLVLPVAKILTLTVLKDKETAPFVMEMPPYHLPTVRAVLGKAFERVWLFVRKITTIVAAVAVVIFVLLQFPGIGADRMAHYEQEKDWAIETFLATIRGTAFESRLNTDNVMDLVFFWENYKSAKTAAGSPEAVAAMNAKFMARDSVLFAIVQPGEDPAAKTINRSFMKLFKARQGLLRDMRKEGIDNSFLGTLGKWLEPVTQWAGFNWRVNVALLSSLAAKESSVATLGALYEQEEEGEALEARMAKGETDFTPLHALALMLFMVLYPPCLATAISVKLQANSVKWMLFAVTYPMVLGLVVAVLVFSGGSALGLSGLEAMAAFYVMALAVTIVTGFIKNKSEYV